MRQDISPGNEHPEVESAKAELRRYYKLFDHLDGAWRIAINSVGILLATDIHALSIRAGGLVDAAEVDLRRQREHWKDWAPEEIEDN